MDVTRTVTLPAPPEGVWAALTEPDGLSSWFGADATVDLRQGGSIEFTWPDGTVRAAALEEIDPPRLLAFRWLPFARAPDGAAIALEVTRVVFRLEPDGNGTTLTITETGVARVARPYAEARA